MRSLWAHRRTRTVDPATAMFRQTRWSLTAWYTAAVALTLLVMGAVLYLGEQASLLSPVDARLHASASVVAQAWRAQPDDLCRGAQFQIDPNYLWACYDPDGNRGIGDPLVGDVKAFQDRSFVADVLHKGSATDTLNSHTALGTIRRYAVRVDDPLTGLPLGVFEIGAPVADPTATLHRLLLLLLASGLVGVTIAALGGLFLAERSLRPARLAYQRQQDFVANASHELRTPLTMVRADAEVLLRDRASLNSDQAGILEDVVLEAAHMASLANKMLDLARLDAGKAHAEREVVDLQALAHELIRRAEALATEAGVSLRLEDGEPAVVLGDPILLEHAALILVDNAIKYNQRGGSVTIRTRRDADRVMLEVRDTGIGIAAEHLPHLGERFYRVDKARSRESGGAGLGLSIVRGIVSQHGGTLQFDSDPGKGTVATISLPALDVRSKASA
jgi:two-component system, OmpR family, sensor histidine kinase CiaH